MLGAGDRVARDEMHVIRHQGPKVAQHRLLHRAHIGEDAARLQVGGDRLPHLGIGANRHADECQVGVFRGLARVGMNGLAELQLGRDLARFL
jgi:hypothetical protein